MGPHTLCLRHFRFFFHPRAPCLQAAAIVSGTDDVAAYIADTCEPPLSGDVVAPDAAAAPAYEAAAARLAALGGRLFAL